MTFSFIHDTSTQCDGKERYVDEVMARRAAMSFRPPLKAYRCPHCREWHIGSIGGSHRGQRPKSRRRGRR